MYGASEGYNMVPIDCADAQVFNLWSADPWGSVADCQGVRDRTKRIFFKMTRNKD